MMHANICYSDHCPYLIGDIAYVCIFDCLLHQLIVLDKNAVDISQRCQHSMQGITGMQQ